MRQLTADDVRNAVSLKESSIPELQLVKRGKIRDIYTDGRYFFLVSTDRISAYDVVSGQTIPYKGLALNQTATHAFQRIITPNHFVGLPDPNVMVAEIYEPVKVEAIARGYLVGSAWRGYEKGKRDFFGVKLPDGMVHGEKLEPALFTPTTKADAGHDVDIQTWGDFVAVVENARDASAIKSLTLELYREGDAEVRKNGGTLVDTKFEFGRRFGILGLIDEAWTHDSSRYLMLEDYDRMMAAAAPPMEWAAAWIDKEYVRIRLAEMGFTGDGPMPALPDEVIAGAASRAMRSYGLVTGNGFALPEEPFTNKRIIKNLRRAGFI